MAYNNCDFKKQSCSGDLKSKMNLKSKNAPKILIIFVNIVILMFYNLSIYMNKKIIILFLFISVLTFGQAPLPNVTLKTLVGQSVTTQEIAENHELMIISLWATWCVPCKNELDAIAEVYQDWISETGVVYYAVSIDDSRTSGRIKPMVNGKDWEFEILIDQNSDLKRAFGVSTVPLTAIIKNGEIVYNHMGYSPGYEDELYKQLLKYSE